MPIKTACNPLSVCIPFSYFIKKQQLLCVYILKLILILQKARTISFLLLGISF